MFFTAGAGFSNIPVNMKMSSSLSKIVETGKKISKETLRS